MPDIQVICGKCGNGFDVPENMAGLIAPCPGCGSQISVPLPPDRAPLAGRLQVRRDVPVGGGKRCPSCGGMMADEAVLCVQCGYDQRTGKRLGGSSASPQVMQVVLAVAGLVILGGLVFTFYRYVVSPRSAPRPPVEAPVAEADEEAFPEPVTPAVEPPPVPVETQAVAAAATAPAKEEIDFEKAAAEFRLGLKNQLDARNPLYRVGEQVALRRTNGQVYRGTLQTVHADRAVVDVGGQATDVPLASLDHSSRVRCDAAFRARVIEFEVQRRIRELQEF